MNRINWNELAMGMSDEIRQICIDARNLEYELETVSELLKIGIFPPINSLVEIYSLTEKIIRQFLGILKSIEKDEKNIEKIEKKFMAMRIEIEKYKEDITRAVVNNNVSQLNIHISIFHMFLYSFVYTVISETRRNAKENAVDVFREVTLDRIGIIPLPEEKRKAEKEELL
ncbi:MAG: hypothetical protein DRN78_05665 [Thermoproteota archaeon]|nr:MAG: hypothetical protein DRN78_05665 [Candidatus Korarchaeota archaeon]